MFQAKDPTASIGIDSKGKHQLEEFTSDFPFLIRSRPIEGDVICDIEQLGLLPVTVQDNIGNLNNKKMFSYVHNPILLPGCATAWDDLTRARTVVSKMIS